MNSPHCDHEGLITLGPQTDVAWRAEYRSHRYMEDMSDSDIQQRMRDIFRNFMTINNVGKASPLSPEHQWHGFWRLRFVHLLEEFVQRFGPFPNGFDTEKGGRIDFPDPRSKRIQAAMTAIDRNGLEDGEFLVKYGKLEHLKEMLHSGIVRISPASAFADLAFNNAIRDNEREMSHWMYNPTLADLHPYLKTTEPKLIFAEGSAIRTRTSEDYYLLCLSASYDAPLFDDFDADACLIIRDPIAFRDRLMWEVHRVLRTRGHTFGPVTYVDPITQIEKTVPIALQKNARHSYQDEVRGAWLPQQGAKNLQVEYVKLGSLEGTAQLVSVG